MHFDSHFSYQRFHHHLYHPKPIHIVVLIIYIIIIVTEVKSFSYITRRSQFHCTLLGDPRLISLQSKVKQLFHGSCY